MGGLRTTKVSLALALDIEEHAFASFGHEPLAMAETQPAASPTGWPSTR